MKSRGYGLKGRSAFSIYRFDERDKNVLVWLIFCGLYVLGGSIAGAFEWHYFPRIDLTIETGEFVVICDPSGCEKSTLLCQLKTVISPSGNRSGEILFDGISIDNLDLRGRILRLDLFRSHRTTR